MNIQVNGILEVHYKNPCCPNCNGPLNTCEIFQSKEHLRTFVNNLVDYIPVRPLVRPVADFLYDLIIGKPPCGQCNHPVSFHEQIYYKTEVRSSLYQI